MTAVHLKLPSTTTAKMVESTTSLPQTSADKMLSRSETPVDGRKDDTLLPYSDKFTPSEPSISGTSIKPGSTKAEKKYSSSTHHMMMDFTSTSLPSSVQPTTSAYPRRTMNGNEPSQPRKEIGPLSPIESFTEGYPTRVTWKKTEPSRRPAPTPGVIPGEGKFG